MKKILSVLLALVMVLSMIPVIASAAETEVVFELGANGSASHYDGSSKTSYSETNGEYTLSITGGTSMYTGARDAQGNSCIKLGTSSKTGGFSFAVPSDVTEVVVSVAKYKANTTKISVNGTTHTLTKSSNDGAYDEITVDTSSSKTVTVTTVSGGVRAMVNSIKFVIPESSCEHANTTTTTVDATCETAGSVTVSCNDCGNTVSYEDIAALGHNYVDGTCSRCGKTTVLTQYELVTNVLSLTAGDEIIVVGSNEGKYYTMLPYDSGNNVKTAEVSAPVENVITLISESEAARITLGGDSTGWTLFDGAKYYNAPGGTSSNHLKGVDTLPTDNTATWTISIADDGVATIVNVGNAGTDARNTIKFNYGNDPDIFSCYKSGYTSNVALVSIYREVKEGADECQHTNTTDLAEVAATCGKSGTTAGVKCLDCGNIISGCEEIPATGEHNFVDYVCGVCGAVTLPVADSELTLPAASAIGAAQASGAYTADKYYVTGTIESVTGETYGNMNIQDEAGNKFYIHGVYSADGTVRYDAMEVKPVAGDTVTLYGVIGNYNGTAQMKNAWLTAHTPAGSDTTCEHEDINNVEAKEPTCTEPGYTAGVLCNDCESYISGHEEIPALGHNYVDGICSVCGAEKPNTPTAGAIDFSTTAQRLSWDTDSQVWSDGYLTVTNNKASSSSNIIDSSNPVRFYKSSEVVIEFPGMTKIEFVCNTADYATALAGAVSGANVITNDNVVSIELPAAADSFTISMTVGQVRVNSISVSALAVCDHAWGEPALTTAPTCAVEGENTYTCTLCGETKTEVVAALGHVDADGFCSVCGGEFYTLATSLNEGDTVAIFNPESGVAMSAEANGNRLGAIATGDVNGFAVVSPMAAMTVQYVEGSETDFYLLNNGMYLTSGATGSSLSFTEEANEYSVWYLEIPFEDDDVVLLNNRNATYTGSDGVAKAQSVEYFGGAFTTYSKSNGKAFQMNLYVKAAPVPTVELTHISLDPNKDALGYKAAATNLPEGAHVEISLWVDESKVVTKATETLRLINILAKGGAEYVIYAKATIVDANGEVIASSEVAQTTMQETLETVSENWSTYTPEQQAAVMAYVAGFMDKIPAGWNLDTIYGAIDAAQAA